MKKTIMTFAIICSLTALGQTTQDYLQSGLSKNKQHDFKGAIIDFDKVIKADNVNKQAFYYRGNCELSLGDFKSALKDINKAIELDPNYVAAYYDKAAVFASQQKYNEALLNLDKTIELDKTFPDALTLRGQLRYSTGNKSGACDDFLAAKAIGDKQVDKYITKFCGNEQQTGESLLLDWPNNEYWKIGDDQENSQQHVIDIIHENETIDKWTELGNMTSIKGVTNIPMDKAMNMMFNQAKQNSPKSKLAFIEKDENTEYPWIIFTIESPSFINDKTPESQLWYIIQGKQALYTNFRAIKQSTIPEELKTKWTIFFKSGKIVNK